MANELPLSVLQHPVLAAVRSLAEGGALHLVGGAVRDALLGRPLHDFDFVIAGGGEALARALARKLGGRFVALGGDRFSAYRVVLHGEGSGKVDIDVWDREGNTLEQDLARRDFTINAMAADITTGGIIDPFSGAQDLTRLCLRATTPRVLMDDPLRVLRAGRLAAQLPGLKLEPATAESARKAMPGLSRVAAERVRAELEALFAAPDPAGGLSVLAAGGTLGFILAGREVKAAEAERVTARVRQCPAGGSSTLLWALCLTALSPPPSADEALARLLEQAWLERTLAFGTRTLLALAPQRPHGELEHRRFLHEAGALQWEGIEQARILAEEKQDGAWLATEWQPLLALRAAEGPLLADPPRLLSGGEAQAVLGLAPGPALGEALRRLRGAQVDGLVRTREEALAWISGEAPRP